MQPSESPIQELADGVETTPTHEQCLTFAIEASDYAVSLAHVEEIIGAQRITHVPDVPAYVRGVINLRGTVVPVVDLRTRFGLGTRETDRRSCIVVVGVREHSVGLLVDTVADVVDVPLAGIEEPPRRREDDANDDDAGMMTHGLVRVEESVKIVLDLERVLFEGHELGADSSRAAARA